MNGIADHLAGRLMELRREFDHAFAAPVDEAIHTTLDLILVQLGADAHAIRVAEIAGLYVDVKMTPCPSPVPTLRGLAGFRGQVLPVYDLAQILGYPRSVTPRWMAVAADAPLALAFDQFTGHTRVEPDAIAPRRDVVANHVREVARTESAAWPLVSIASVVAEIRRQVPDFTEAKE